LHNADDVKLRNAHVAVIDRDKVLDYRLNEAHPDSGGQARFFAWLGFSRDDPERLMNAFRDRRIVPNRRSTKESDRGTCGTVLISSMSRVRRFAVQRCASNSGS